MYIDEKWYFEKIGHQLIYSGNSWNIEDGVHY